MSKPKKKIDIRNWIQRAGTDTVTYRQRQVINVILTAIAATPELNKILFLKGGTLMGLAYESPRQTSDIDFSVGSVVPDESTSEYYKSLLNSALPRAAATIGYADIVLRVQKIRELPRNIYPKARFPALELKIAYADRGSRQETLLEKGQASNIISVDLSFNETASTLQVLEINEGEELEAYSLADLVAEKYRALLQQEFRRRHRSQDVYDLDFLIQKSSFNDELQSTILTKLIEKCHSHDVVVKPNTIDNSEIRKRAKSEWETLKLEIEEVPDFDLCFERIAEFYRQLPWSK